MKVILLKIEKDLTWDECKEYLLLLPEERKNKCQRYVIEEKKITSLLSSLLIIKEMGKDKNISFNYNQYGKPYIKENSDLFFSVSHSDEYIAFVQDTKEIGIDIEKINIFNQKVAKKFFTTEENTYLEKSTNLNIDSYKIWTQKEAYLKKIGTGFSNGGYKINILDLDIQKNLKTTQIYDYMLTVAAESAIDEIKLTEITSRELLNR